MDDIVLEDIDNLANMRGKELDSRARYTAEALVKGDRLKTHQLRNIYSAVAKIRTKFQQNKKMSDELEDEVFLLKPKLAYAAGRNKSVNATLFPFMNNLIEALDKSKAEERDKAAVNFFLLLESVVGYHKFFEKNKNVSKG